MPPPIILALSIGAGIAAILTGVAVKSSGRKPPQSCLVGFQCKNKACGLPEAGADKKICCQSGSTTRHWDPFNPYCMGIESGKKCWSDVMCAGGICSDNAYGVKTGTCSGDGKVGVSCSRNNQCANKACGRLKAGTDSLVCCPSGEVTMYAGYDYCTKMPTGTTCWSDAMCAGGICSDNVGGTKKGKCSGDVPVNDKCKRDNQCANKACGRLKAGTDSLVCCPSGAHTTYGGYDYCTKMPTGTTCWSDAMCAGGICSDNVGGTKKGKCSGDVPVNDKCKRDNQCANKKCARLKAGTDNLNCCPSGGHTTYGGYDYCTKMPSGNVCWSDAMCASGTCKDNMSGLRKGKCA